jgi:hypothetical protein
MSWPEIAGSFEFFTNPTNIVEGSAHRSTRECLNFLNIARASGADVAYLVQLTYALEILSKSSFAILDQMCQQFVPQLEGLVDSVEQLWIEEPRAQRLKPEAKDGHDPANDSGTSLFALPRW